MPPMNENRIKSDENSSNHNDSFACPPRNELENVRDGIRVENTFPSDPILGTYRQDTQEGKFVARQQPREELVVALPMSGRLIQVQLP
jgi:hypothetical protein